MTEVQLEAHKKDNWKRTRALALSIGLPVCGILFSVIVGGTKALDKLDAVATKQDTFEKRTDDRFDKTDERLYKIDQKVNQIQLHQHDDSLLNAHRYNYVQRPHTFSGRLMHSFDKSGNVIPGGDKVVANR